MASSGKGAGGWLRFQKVLATANREKIAYHFVEFKNELPVPVTLGILEFFFSMLFSIIRALKKIKKNNINLILSPTEDPQATILSYVASKITARKFAVFMNTIPYYGSVGVQNVSLKREAISYKELYTSLRGIKRSNFRAILEAFVWYLSFKVLESPSANILCLSSVVAEAISKIGLKKQIASTCIGNGINYTEIVSLTSDFPREFDAIYATGNFSPQKGIFEVAKIWRAVVDRLPDAKLAIAGVVYYENPDVFEEFDKLIQNLNIKKNIFLLCDPLRGLPQFKLWNEMNRAKVFLYPTMKDVWPLIIGEALACGLPVVTYGLPGILNAYGDCKSVCIVNVRDVKNSAMILVELISNEKLLKELSDVAREYAKQHSWHFVSEIERNTYLTILSKDKQYSNLLQS
ncbi:MAG: glycosyltransferase [Candidatus Bathyarchaeota archaeon]|nr:glycosyltransferase [Candidatus Bathyarchaeota archaeon]